MKLFTNPSETKLKSTILFLRISALVLVLGMSLYLNACSNYCEKVPLESSQQAFVDSMLVINNLMQSDLFIETYYDECPTSRIYELHNNRKKLVRLPNNIKNLTTLRGLSLPSAGLDSLPIEILSLKNLRSVLLDDNHLCNVSPAMDTFLTQRSANWEQNQVCP